MGDPPPAPTAPPSAQPPQEPIPSGSPEAPPPSQRTGTPDPGPSSPDRKAADWTKGRECDKLDPELKRKVEIFNAKLDKNKMYVVVVSCHRDRATQTEWHYARFITWDESHIKKNLKIAGSDQVAKIKSNALERFKEVKGLAKTESSEIQDAQGNDAKVREIKSRYDKIASDQAKAVLDAVRVGPEIPVLPGEQPCPCGCGWSLSKHILDPSKAVDLNIFRRSLILSDDPVVTLKVVDLSKKDLIDNLTRESGLFWGINFTEIPRDQIHWELP